MTTADSQETKKARQVQRRVWGLLCTGSLGTGRDAGPRICPKNRGRKGRHLYQNFLPVRGVQ